MFVHSRRFWFFLALGTFAAYAQVNVTLDFAKLEHRVDGFWGYSLAQFADDSAAEHAPVRGVFSNIGGFPDDGSTIFGDYCDRFFSVKYMAAHYSVDGFAGRGRNEAIVIANGADKRAFKISSNGLTAQIFSVYQCAGSVTRKPLSPVSMSSGVISIEVPANSVTTLVASKPSTASRGYLVVASPAVLTERDRIITDALRSTGIDLQILGSTLNDSDFVRYQEKRHPVDAMGAALYIIAPSVSAKACLYAYRTVAAPVLGFGSVARTILGCEYGKHIRAGSSLSFCDNETDPPANILASGLPLACGDRIVLAGQSIAGDVTVAAQTLLGLPTTGYLSDNRPPAPPQMTTDFRAGDRIEVRDISGRLLRAYGKDGISRVSNENYIYGSGCMVISVVRNGKIIRTHKTHRMR